MVAEDVEDGPFRSKELAAQSTATRYSGHRAGRELNKKNILLLKSNHWVRP